MTANRGLFPRFAVVACIVALLGLLAPASATEMVRGSEQRASGPDAPKSQGWRSAAVQARRDYRPHCSDPWCGRNFVLILGVSY
jgi:hypothetical protein